MGAKIHAFDIFQTPLSSHYPLPLSVYKNTDKKENQIFFICKEIPNGAVAKSYMRKGFQMYEEMRKYLTTYEEAFSHI
jgi:hypothetical protein